MGSIEVGVARVVKTPHKGLVFALQQGGYVREQIVGMECGKTRTQARSW